MNTNEYPELVTFLGRQSRHSCFQNRFHGARSGAASDFIKAVVGDQADSKLRTGAGDLEEYLMAELESVTRVSCSELFQKYLDRFIVATCHFHEYRKEISSLRKLIGFCSDKNSLFRNLRTRIRTINSKFKHCTYF